MKSITISEILENNERCIMVGKAVAYGEVAEDGSTYSLSHAPTQHDFDVVAAALDGMTEAEIAACIQGEEHQHGSVEDGVDCEVCNPQGLTVREYRTAIERGNDPKAQTIACTDCGAEIVAEFAYVVPAVDDEQAWADAGGMHNQDCEWVSTRAHRLR